MPETQYDSFDELVEAVVDELPTLVRDALSEAFNLGFEAGKISAGEPEEEEDNRPLVTFQYHGVERVVRLNEFDADHNLLKGIEVTKNGYPVDEHRSYKLTTALFETPVDQAIDLVKALEG